MTVEIVEHINGKTYIGDVQKDDSTEYVWVKNAVTLELQPTEQGGVSVGIAPVSYFMDMNQNGHNITLRTDHIVFRGLPSAQIKNEYNKTFGNGIVTDASPGLITG